VLCPTCVFEFKENPLGRKFIHAFYSDSMRIVNPRTGHRYVEKRRRRYAGQARDLTFSCYRRFPFLAASARGSGFAKRCRMPD
jgi:hypothetical protein